MTGCPNFEFIRKKISITDVARELGLRVNGSRAHCWRTESHRNNDASPSIGFRKQQNTGRCFVCDAHTWSSIDLVMLFRDCDRRQAVSWITARFSVPLIPKGSHLRKRENWCPLFRSGDTDTVIEMLVRSGLWCSLSHAERSILPALHTFLKRDMEAVQISYCGLMRYSGVRSPATIARAIRHFQQMGFLEVVRARATGPLRQVNQYRFTFDNPGFQAMAAKVFQQKKAEIELERQMRDEARKARRKKAVLV